MSQLSRYVNRLLMLFLAVSLLLISLGTLEAAVTGQPDREPSGAAGQHVVEQYIVVLKDNVTDVPGLAQKLAVAHDGSVLHIYEHAVKGFAVKMAEGNIEALRRNLNVAYVEQDQVVTVVDTQSPATWGLDRIDQRDLPLDNVYTHLNTGLGVNAYVIDTGIRRRHNEFGGRAFHGFTSIKDRRGSNDCNGHGTHVAGTIGGVTYGVAKEINLFAVRVLDCNGVGTTSTVIAGVDWVTANHTKPAVANMSLGGSASTALDNAVRNSIAAGVTYSIAAGNGDIFGNAQNACDTSPARVTEALTVSATDDTDTKASWANFGTCVDIFAPGVEITSAWHTSNSATRTQSGTSMAAPHVAGVAALYLETSPGALPSAVGDAILNNATTERLSRIGFGSPNRLLYSLLDNVSAPPPGNDDPPAENVLVNGDFEAGPGVGWQEHSEGGYGLVTQELPHGGQWGARLGGTNSASDAIYQETTIPSNGTLTYMVRIESQEPSGAPVNDTVEVHLYDAGTRGHIATLRQWNNQSTRNTWHEDTIDLSPYAGQVVLLVFHGQNDSTDPSSFFIDDVLLR